MKSSLKQAIIRSVKHSWEIGNLVEAGRLLYERIPRASRPLWGADILEFASQRISKVPEIQNVIAFARTPEEWANSTSREKRSNAHNFFDAVRRLTLEEDRKDQEDKLYINVLLLAENVAKVTYNSYGYNAPFDHDAGWWIVAILKSIVDIVNDIDFSATAWKVLTNEAYIELETPTKCNPYCTTCRWQKTFEIE
ncbi:MAG TPA: hypothetical protein VGA72_13700 [Anaerolineales bacterium]